MGTPFNMSPNESLRHGKERHVSSDERQICRICLQCTESSMDEITSWAAKIEFVTKLTLHAGDGFPAYICNQCKFNLDIAYGFIKLSIATDVFLRSRHSEGSSQPCQDMLVSEGEPAQEFGVSSIDNLTPVCTELYQTDGEPFLHVKLEPDATSADGKPETDPLQLYSEQSQLKTDCNVGIVMQFHTYAIQTQATATNQAENPLLATYQSPPLINNIEAFSEQSDTEGPLAFLVKTEFPAEVDPLLHSDNDNDDDFTNYPPAGSPNPTDDDFEVPVNDEDIGVSGRHKMPSKKAQGRTGGKNMLGKKSHPFPCSRCDASFKVKTYLNLHLRSHSPLGKGRAEQKEQVRNKVEYKKGTLAAKPFPCPICGKLFVRKKNMTNHMEMHHQPVVVLPRVTCDTQAQASQNSSESAKLVDTVSDQAHADLNVKQRSKFICDHCGNCYYKRKQLLRHLRAHFEQECYKCDECQKEFLIKSRLTSHMKCHFHEPIFKCFKCKKKFADKVGLMAHEILRRHSKGAFYNCRYCPKSLQSKYHLKMHRDHFHPLKKCDGCDRKFFDISKLAIHIQVMHLSEYDGLNCFRCKKTFGSKMKLETHLYVSSCRSFFACNKCSITFETKASLKNHLLVHTDDGFICCEICKIMNTSLSKALQIFENQENLRQHIKEIHSTENFKCRKCRQYFNTQNNLDQHVPNCSVSKASCMCPICQRTYSNNYKLKTHLAKHADLKPHKCRRCFEGFADVASAEIHRALQQCTAVFQCPVCPRTFARKSIFIRHKTYYHNKDNTYNCYRCAKPFGNRATMEEHFYQKVCEGPFKCTTCPKSFGNQNNLTVHIERMHANKQGHDLQCSVCKKYFKSELSLEKHTHAFHISAKKHVCKTCGAKFAAATSLDKHTKQQACKSPFQCEVCLKGFLSRPSLKRHSIVHSNARNMHCSQCNMFFKYKVTLVRHQRTRHSQAEPSGPIEASANLCDMCGVSYPTLADLESHAYSHLFVKDRFTCGYCGEEFTDKALLGYHMRLHLNKRKTEMPKRKCIQCMHCAKVFSTHHQLFYHTMRVHNGNRPFACDTCGRSFATKDEIRRHVVNHTKIRLRCDICTKSTTSKFQMRIHVRKHTGEKPFGCKVCCETFISNYNLKGHVARMHSKHEHFDCHACKESFSSKSTLLMHLFKHTEKLPFSCEVCTAGFTRKVDVDRHQKRQHPELFRSSDLQDSDQDSVVVLSFGCSMCLKAYKNFAQLDEHYKVEHGYFRVLYVCEICGFAFKSNRDLSKHAIAGHTLKLPRSCSVCSKYFLSSSLESRHLRIFHKVDFEEVPQ